MGNQNSEFFRQQLHNLHVEFITTEKLFRVNQIQFPLSTHGVKIVDAKGKRVKLAAVNWSGAHMCRHCVDGLQYRKLSDICSQIIDKFGFNTVRLTYSLEMYYEDKIIPQKYLTANPNLIGLKAMQIFDIVVQQLTKAGIMVILNNHISSSMWCCSETDGQGLWWTHRWPQYRWLQHLKHFAIRYQHNPRVIGIDIRNEIRKTPQYAPTWGDGNPVTDWRRASILGANEVLKANPKLLVLIGGLNYGLNLSGMKNAPIQPSDLAVPNKLVLTGHFYGFSWVVIWAGMTYEMFKQKIFQQQTFVRALGVPFFLGEFGTNIADTPWKYLMRYLKENDLDWSYWPLDGFKCEPQKDETYGIYNNNFSGVRHPWLLNDLQDIQKSNIKSMIKNNTKSDLK